MDKTLSYFITMLYKHFSTFCNEKLQEIGLSQGLIFFILYIGKNPNCSPGKLSSDLNLDTGHTTRSIDKLQQSGFVIREKNATDKRAYVLNLTEKGEAAFKLSYDLFNQWDDELMEHLSQDEKIHLISSLSQLIPYKGGIPCVRKDK